MAHWYEADGTLHTHVPNKSKGGMREATIKDARENGWKPSVTTVITILSKPMVVDWSVRQAVKAARQYPDRDVEELVKLSEEYRDWAAQWGTDFHASVAATLREQRWIGNIEVMDLTPPFIRWLDTVGFIPLITERTFVSEEHGYAGTLDLVGSLNNRPVIVDIKTQDFTVLSEANFYEEYPLQLSGYALGIGEPDLNRWSFVVSRKVPGLVATKNWSEKPGSNERDARKWLALWNLWVALKEWDNGTAA